MKASFLLACSIIILAACQKEKKSTAAALKMQEFIIGISDYARSIDSDFIIVPQNGEALAYTNANPDGELNLNFLNSIDGFGVEEIFYNGDLSIDTYRLQMLQEISATKKVMVSEYLLDNNNVADAINRNYNEGFLCFPRVSLNYDYVLIPDSVIQENSNPILQLSDAQNYLYLISNSNYSTKQEMIDAIAATNFDVIIIDAFFEEDIFTASEIAQLKTKSNGAQRLVLAYMSVGSAENYRYYWQEKWRLHKPNWLKKKYDGYKDEIWVEYWNQEWKDIIYGNDNSYIKKIIDAGFDGTYLDNVEAYYFLYYKN